MQLAIFKYDRDGLNQLTTVEIEGEIWFLASDLCKVLEIQNVTQALSTLDDDEKLPYVIHRLGQKRTVNLVNESGLYALIFKSRKPSAQQFRKWVTKEVIPAIRKSGAYMAGGAMPNFIVRYNDNWHKLDTGYFSVITELYARLYMRFEKEGYVIPDKSLTGTELRPDVSVGKCFANFLDSHYPAVCKDYKYYKHTFQNGVEVDARQYPIELLPIFIRFIDNHWLPKNAEAYFKERDVKALKYLPKLLRAS
ncbi:BRO-N domain-containing protein [Niabella insulamsoli]|uniref:BRO-N domain-containing protein n=1 Tax=Niabella insulamsoli TaxID=3144874 RepID=UPI0031FBBD61